jgi:hypothetical protein
LIIFEENNSDLGKKYIATPTVEHPTSPKVKWWIPWYYMDVIFKT